MKQKALLIDSTENLILTLNICYQKLLLAGNDSEISGISQLKFPFPTGAASDSFYIFILSYAKGFYYL